jgi:DNA-binding GntR family transcriptional regulator
MSNKKLAPDHEIGIKEKRTTARLRAEDTAANSTSGVSGTLWRLLTNDGSQNSLVATMAHDIGLDIIEGRLKAGDDLNSVELAQRFSTSRTPAREALALLEKQGLVEIPARRRPRVRGANPAEIQNIYEIRAAMHGLVCELVTERASAEDIALLKQRFESMRSAAHAGEVHEYFLANMAFHDACTQVCGNPLLQRSLDSLGLITFNLRYRTLSHSGRVTQSLEDHSLLMRAFEERNPTLAASIIRSNIHSALRALQDRP